MQDKQRVIQEYVPGKQVTLAHLIANPSKDLYKKLGLIADNMGALGILTITPGEAAIIAADVATKAADVTIGFVDRFSGTVIIIGDVGSVESALTQVLKLLASVLNFAECSITKS
ncbi:BMC domain-containing protein [Clostridium sp.]|uniref:BMC domain-containing protein n=1 Tax=Clostridium sp. TaxID=1506 RepID=UPI002627EB74|nr:BMC domain-containing protein [uncultured Clostridium sp.]